MPLSSVSMGSNRGCSIHTSHAEETDKNTFALRHSPTQAESSIFLMSMMILICSPYLKLDRWTKGMNMIILINSLVHPYLNLDRWTKGNTQKETN